MMRHLDRANLFNLIIGVLSRCFWTPAANSETSPVTSNTFNCFHYGHCQSSQEGVRGLDCYRKQSEKNKKMRCEWTPGRHSSNKTNYTLVIEQKDRESCMVFPNIYGTSHLFQPYAKYNMTAYVVEASGDDGSCTMAVLIAGKPNDLASVRCDPPSQITFLRHSRLLVMQVSAVGGSNSFHVNYREQGSQGWKKEETCTVGDLTSSMSYEVRVKCVENKQCVCIWSDVAIVPPELTSTPVIERFDVIPLRKGCRLITAHWKLANNESVTGYIVTVGKESGEFTQPLNTTKPIVRLNLSESAYQINISAFNSAGTSPPAQRRVPAVHSEKDFGKFIPKNLDGDLNVTFNDNGSSEFKVSWNPSLSRSYSCYSVEWGLREEKMSYFSLYEKDGSNFVIPLKVPLQHYKRYTFLLHTRPYKDTCELKGINSSESTRGWTEAYAVEGTPTKAPIITCSDVTSNSLTIVWSDIPEQYVRGFLLGYVIYYAESYWGKNFSELILDAGTNNHTLTNLKGQTFYEVRLSAFTAAGEGVRTSFDCKTRPPDYQTVGGTAVGIVVGIMVLLLVANLCSRLFERAKKLFWPSIPNPGNSNAIQKIDDAFQLEVLEPLNRERLAQTEEGDTSSLLIVEGGAEMSPAAAGCPRFQADEEPSSSADLGTEEESPFPSGQAEPAPIAAVTIERRATPAAVSDYTTMELFQQTMSQPPAVPQPLAAGTQRGLTLARPEQDYIRQNLCHTLSHPNAADELSDQVCFSVL
ncbi:hypothetical protein AAFF_G00374340 [Aldrovandia affinis]|uniref:Fibronectin type-III domain-containing protein n=1 Tax=Aldrovandia affinis TaxID=143900 RepID=A0AAD7SGB9_9TELE|nr:hypothetical protein AAFF_G00374340 [Aldrovandia affinis]